MEAKLVIRRDPRTYAQCNFCSCREEIISLRGEGKMFEASICPVCIKELHKFSAQKTYLCSCGKEQSVPEMREEVGDDYTQYCCSDCGEVLIDDISGEIYAEEVANEPTND